MGGVQRAGVERTELAGRVVARFSKPGLEGVDSWSHWEHHPDNNPVSTDTALKWPCATQWMALPFYSPQPNNTLVSAGRMFTWPTAANGR